MRRFRFLAVVIPLLFLCLFIPIMIGSTLSQDTIPLPQNWEDTVREYVLEGLISNEEIIDFTPLPFSLTEEHLRQVFSILLAREPNLFFVSQEYTLKKKGDTLLYMRPTYLFTGEALSEAKEDFAARLASILSPIDATWSPLEQVLYLHDTLITTLSYDTSPMSHNPYYLLTAGKGVCQSYALLFKALCGELSIPCETVLCFEKQHAWNMVKLGEYWYHLDMTWDETEVPYLGRVPHTYFLLDDATLRARRAENSTAWQDDYTWLAPASATDATFASLSLSQSFGTASVGTGTIYFSTSSHIYSLNPKTLVATPVFSYPKEEIGNPYVTMATLDGQVYFNLSRTIYRIDPTGRITPLSTQLETGLCYLGIAVSCGTLIYQTKRVQKICTLSFNTYDTAVLDYRLSWQ